jgi:glycosyltransferase involved in cell wall biosynthesis
MKLLHVCGKQDWGGGENQLLLIIDEIAKDVDKIDQFLLCPSHSEISKKIIENKIDIKVITSKKQVNLDPRFIYSIFETVRKNNITLIHVHDPDAHSLVILAIDIFRLKTKVILHKKTIFPIKDKKYSLYKYNHKNIKHIICVSEASKKSIEKKITSIPISVVYDAIKSINKKEKINTSNEFTVLNVANHTRHKNLFTLLDIANECINVRKLPFKFIQIGHGKLTNELIVKHNKLGLNEKFEFKGFSKDVNVFYENCDAFLFTSVREGLGVSLLEAIQYKLPIISSNAGGIPEVIVNNEEGLLCDFDDVNCYVNNLEKVYNSKELVKQLTDNAFVKIKEKFSTENMIQKLKSIYYSI